MTPSCAAFKLSNPTTLIWEKKNAFPSLKSGFKPQFEIFPIDGKHPIAGQNSKSLNRSEYFQIIYLNKGSCISQVDFDHFNISNQNLGFIRPGQNGRMDFCPDAQGYILRFTSQYLNESFERFSSLNPAARIRFGHLPNLVITDSEKLEMTYILHSMAKQHSGIGQSGSDLFCLEVINELLKVFLIYLSRILTDRPDFKGSQKISLVEKFFVLLESRYKTFKAPADYAEALEISSGYLNELLKKNCGFTTGYYISQRVVMEARRLIIYSDTSMKEIAYQLGFDDMSHFSKLFKRVAGESFTEYRKKLGFKI